MLFSGEEVLKSIDVLSGGEKVRCMLSKMMLLEGNVLTFDTPTNHLDLESIQALNNAMIDFSGTILFYSHDHALTDSVANRIIEITPNSNYDKLMTYKEFIEFYSDNTNSNLKNNKEISFKIYIKIKKRIKIFVILNLLNSTKKIGNIK